VCEESERRRKMEQEADMSHAATHCDDSPGCSGPSTCT
jgi:hypothetical protein